MNSFPGLRSGLFAISLLAVAGSAPGAVSIDPFSGPQSAPGGVITLNTADNAGIIGGERDLIASALAGVSIDTVIPGQLQMTFRDDINPTGVASVEFTYDGNDNSAGSGSLGGLGFRDLTQGGLNDRFRISITSIMSSPVLLIFSAGNIHMSSTNIMVLPTVPGDVDIPFSSFTHQDLPAFPSPADFQSIGFLELQFEFGSGQVIDIDSITAVPEPASPTLMVAVLLVAGGFLRSRR